MQTFQERKNILEETLVHHEIDLGIITSPADIFYFTGFNSEPHERFMALILNIKTNDTFLFVPALDEEAAKQKSNIEKIIPISDEESPFEVVKNTIGNVGSAIGVEGKSFSYARYIELIEAFHHPVVLDIQPFVSQQRLHKSPDEIASIKLAIEIIEKVMEEGIKKIRVGMTEQEIVAELELLMRKFGADGTSFDTIVLVGENAALPHGHPGSRVVCEGDFVLIDMGIIKNGYCSDITRTFIVGNPTEQQQEVYDIVKEATIAGLQSVQADLPLKTFDLASRKIIEENGYGIYFNNRVGHGLGIEVHEEPSIHSENDSLARKGMVFTIEPGIYIPGYGGVRIEDNVYINENGEPEILTSFTRELIIIQP
ncbi:M24 family metallopeptidase [Rummeliibacillus pycnus]|uniref:M24 family metallopeptidase n=1 Tax=Rummeliibacillus pycnus TaxID=101070 RepID=UPI003D271900